MSGRDTNPHPVLSAGSGISDVVKFLEHQKFLDLPVPWPRCQDVTVGYEVPTSDDIVVAVSHDWLYQTHPDPLGEKAQLVKEQLEQVRAHHTPRGRLLIFVDFLSVPQRPFRAGQLERTDEEQGCFEVALGLMPRIYLTVDAVIHVSAAWSTVPGDGVRRDVKAADLEGASFGEIGETLQVMATKAPTSLRKVLQQPAAVAPFDLVEAVNGEPVHNLTEFEELRDAAPHPGLSNVSVIKAPYGRRNTIPADERGWIYLERFISMVKEAMLDELQSARTVNFSNYPSILDKLHEGASRLRGAGKTGKIGLNREMDRFFDELLQKRFSPTSTDAHCGETRHLGAALSPAGETSPRFDRLGSLFTNRSSSFAVSPASPPSPAHNNAVKRVPSMAFSGDAMVVRALMKGFVVDLQEQWKLRQKMQKERVLLLAVNRGDSRACEALLRSGVDPNFREEPVGTCLHVAALHADVELSRVLLESQADPTIRDSRGRCPAHIQSYYSNDKTLELFDMLAPSEEVLASTNASGVSVAMRFSSWASTATMQQELLVPFQPARAKAAALAERYPALLPDSAKASRSPCLQSHLLVNRSVECTVRGKSFQATIWEPRSSVAVEYSVLYLAVSHAPWKGVHEYLAQYLAESLQFFHAVQLVAVSHDAFPVLPDSCGSTADLEMLHQVLAEIVDELPLRAPCVLLDDSMGTFTPALWTLGPRLAGALVINPGALWDEDYLQMEAYETFARSIKVGASLFRKRDTPTLVKILGTFVFAPPDDMLDAQNTFAAAASLAPPEFWDLCDLRIRLMERAIFDSMKQQNRLSPPIPTILAYGGLSPAAMVQRSVERYHELIPGSETAVISNSKLIPGLEGVVSVSQHEEISAMLSTLLTKLSLQKRHKQEAWWKVLCCKKKPL